MPVHSYDVIGFAQWPVARGLTRYEATLQGRAADVAGTVVSTLHPLRASLLERAWKLKKPVIVGWRETKYGAEAITVTLTTDPPVTDSQEVLGGVA